MDLTLNNFLSPCASFVGFSEIPELVHKVAEHLAPKDLVSFAKTCKAIYKGISYHNRALLNRAEWLGTLKWSYLHAKNLKDKIEKGEEIAYSDQEIYSKGVYLCDFAKKTFNETDLEQKAEADFILYQKYALQKSSLKISFCTANFFVKLLQLPNLQSLKCFGTSFKDFPAVPTVNLPLTISLTSLTLRSINLSEDIEIAIGELLKSNRTLKVLKFKDTSLSDVGLGALATALCVNQTLRKLHLYDPMEKTGFSSLMEALTFYNKTIKSLTLPNFPELEDCANALIQFIVINKTIQNLTMKSYSGIGYIPKICFALSVNQGLRKFESIFYTWTWADAISLLNNERLEKLSFYCPPKEYRSVTESYFTNVLKKHPNLKTLEIFSMNTSDKKNLVGDNISEFAKASQINKIIEKLFLRNHDIGFEGIDGLSANMLLGAPITVLDLSKNNLKKDSFIRLAEAIRQSTTLKKLNLASNEAGSAGAVAIANALIENKKIPIEAVSLYQNQIGIEGAAAFAKLIGSNKSTLKYLFLGYHFDVWNKENYEILIQGLTQNDYLKYLSIWSLEHRDDRLWKLISNKPWLEIVTGSPQITDKEPKIWK